MGPNIHRHPSQTPFTHHPYTDTCPYPISPMAPYIYTHPSPKPFHPWAQTLTDTHPQTPFHPSPIHRHLPLIPFHPWPTILTHIHPLNPFTHGPKHSHTVRHLDPHIPFAHRHIFTPQTFTSLCPSFIVMIHEWFT